MYYCWKKINIFIIFGFRLFIKTFQDKLLKTGEDYTPAALYGEKAGKTVEGFKSLDLKTKEEYEKELEEKLINLVNSFFGEGS